MTQERIGELMVTGETILYALFPILIAHVTKIMPPILFGGLSTLTAGIALFVYMVFKKEVRKLMNWRAIKYAIGITVFIIIIPSILIFTGSSKTSGVNTTILLQSEIFFTLVICGIFTDEKVTTKKVIGAITMVGGTLLILLNGNFKINIGDILIIAGTFFYPIGNIFAKKALTFSPPSVILFIRSIFGGIVLLLISWQFETHDLSISQIISNNYLFILANGILIYAISKIFWYESIKRIDISKSILISVGAYPAISLLFAFLFLREIPTVSQIGGLIIILVGIFQIIERKSGEFSIRIGSHPRALDEQLLLHPIRAFLPHGGYFLSKEQYQ
ncbi:MAG: DMT family transporter [Candidatus Gracilibacteria bacterium]